MTTQVIEKDARPEYAVVPWNEFQALRERAAMVEEVQEACVASQRIDAGEETYPDALAGRLLDGENPVHVWREYRDLSEQALAEAVGLTVAEIGEIEAEEREVSVTLLKLLSEALDVEREDLVRCSNE